MAETTFSRKLRTKIHRIHWDRMENWVSAGMADLNGVHRDEPHTEVWVETKYTETRRVKFRPMQIPWMLKRYAAGSNVWCVVEQKTTKVHRILLYTPVDLIKLAEQGVDGAPARLQFPAPFNENTWNSLYGIFRSPQARGLRAL